MSTTNILIMGESSEAKLDKGAQHLRTISFETLSHSEPDLAFTLMRGYLGALARSSMELLDESGNTFDKRNTENSFSFSESAINSLPTHDFYLAEPTDIYIFKDPVPDNITDPTVGAIKKISIRPVSLV